MYYFDSELFVSMTNYGLFVLGALNIVCAVDTTEQIGVCWVMDGEGFDQGKGNK